MNIGKSLEDLYYDILHSINTTSFEFKEFHANALPARNNLFESIFDSKQSGIIIKDFLSKEEIATFFINMDKYSHELTLWRMGHIIKTLGGGLQEAGANLAAYFNHTPILKQEVNKLFGFDFDKRVIEVFQKLSNGLPVEIAKLSETQHFAGCNIRVAEPDKDGIPEHVGLEFFEQHASLKYLKDLVDISGQLSFFSPLQLPQSGGDLRLYKIMFEDMPKEIKESKKGYRAVQKFVRHQKTQLIKPGVGDLLIFNGGHIWHRVTKVIGPKPRMTVGGFANFSSNRDKILLWS